MIITPEQFSTAYGKLPFPIREYLAGDELGEVTEAVGKEFGLHIDTVGALDREVTNMLLGLINPEQFVGELRSVGIPQENISALVKELNAKVFMPLREKMQNAPPEPAPQPEVSAPIEEVAPMMQAPIITPAPVYVAPPAYTAPLPAATPTPMPAPTPTQLRPEPFVPVMENVHIAARTMQHDMEIAQADPQATTPQPSAPVAPVPTPTRPAYVAPQSVSSVSTPATTAPAAQPTENRAALHEVLKGYGVDPYREPPV
jgi:hypothetical protein